ncbi:uncharacterized protein LOC134277481 [Saccostrea cucullata]|uniref:uncharacterized protein LOC134277481 n=1 Tax=Saccostrea cuccullata TaxID=36930 RepID=UPI002ED3CDD9
MLRLLCFYLCITFIICDPLEFLSEKEKEALGKMHILDLPENAQRVVRAVTLHGNATAHWCCNVATTKKITQTHSQLLYTKQIRDRVSHHHCGFLGLSRCARHHYYYISVPQYKTTYSVKVIHTSCPNKNLVCCKGYVLVAGSCVPLSEISNIKDDLINLHNGGIVVG